MTGYIELAQKPVHVRSYFKTLTQILQLSFYSMSGKHTHARMDKVTEITLVALLVENTTPFHTNIQIGVTHEN